MKTAINTAKHRIAFSTPKRLTRHSFWVEHIPFAFYLVDLLRPKRIVELGTQHGDSYCAFCQAVHELDLKTRCCAVDTWNGDRHVGLYGPDVLADLRAHHDHLYGRFSRLIVSTFDDAAPLFGEATIDLLHIDGTHTYEAVRNDFETWLPKMSSRGVVLFHDTAMKGQDFGVWRVWEEIRSGYPHLEFMHGCGLGVLAVGKKQRRKAARFFQACHDKEYVQSVRNLFSQLGQRLSLVVQLNRTKEELEVERATRQGLEQDRSVEQHREQLRDMQARLELIEQERDALRAAVSSNAASEARTNMLLTNLRKELTSRDDHLRTDLASRDDHLRMSLRELRTPVTAHESRQFTDERARRRLLAHLSALVSKHVPPGSVIAVVSKGDDELVKLASHRGWHFPRAATGDYAGYHPATDIEAIVHLEDLRSKGVGCLLIPSSSLWWLEYYPLFSEHLRQRYRLMHSDSQAALFDLQRQAQPKSDPFDARLSGKRVLVVIPGSVNYFYDLAGHRIGDALRSLGCSVRISDLSSAANNEYDWSFFVNPYEICFSCGETFSGAACMERVQSRCDMSAAVLLECAKTDWFSKTIDICQQAGITRLLDLGFSGQHDDIPPELQAGYHFAFNGLTTAEFRQVRSADRQRSQRRIPWVLVGHAAGARLILLEQLLREADPGGFVYLPQLSPVAQNGPHLNGSQLRTVLERAHCQVWCSHHDHFYLESERFRDALLAGCIPLKLIQRSERHSGLIPFQDLCVPMSDFAEVWPALNTEDTWRQFLAEFTALPTLEESLTACLSGMESRHAVGG